MKTTIRLFVASVLLLLVTGCYINKRGYLCGITLGEYMCDPVLDAWLSRGLLPIDTYWPLSNQTKETRKEDWVECGGSPYGYVDLKPLPDGQARTREQKNREWERLSGKVAICMQKKGYQYIPRCFSLEDCGPPPPAPNGSSWPAWVLREAWPPKAIWQGYRLPKKGYVCDPVLDVWLTSGIFPIHRYWPLNNQTEQTRREDWVECGGFPDGMLAIEPLADGQTRTREQSDREWARIWDKVDLCMQNKGYQYFPICFTLDEKCGPPPPAPNGGSWPAWLLRQSWPEKSLCLRMR